MQETDYLEKFLKISPVFYALLRAIECRHMSGTVFEMPVLDLGCGDGMFGNILFDSKPGAISYGIDLCLEDIQKAKETNIYRLLQMADIERLPFADNSIGSIFSNSVFEHLESIDMALNEAMRVLKPGGKLVLTSPNSRLVDNFFFARLLRSIGFKQAARAVGAFGNKALGNSVCLSPEQWKQKAAGAGFPSVEIHHIIPPRIFHISEAFMPFATVSILSKKLFGRLLFFDRRITLKMFHSMLYRRYACNSSDDGLASMVICSK